MRKRMCTIYDTVLMLPSIYFYAVCSLLCSQAEPGCICSFHLTFPPLSPSVAGGSHLAIFIKSAGQIQLYDCQAASPKS